MIGVRSVVLRVKSYVGNQITQKLQLLLLVLPLGGNCYCLKLELFLSLQKLAINRSRAQNERRMVSLAGSSHKASLNNSTDTAPEYPACNRALKNSFRGRPPSPGRRRSPSFMLGGKGWGESTTCTSQSFSIGVLTRSSKRFSPRKKFHVSATSPRLSRSTWSTISNPISQLLTEYQGRPIGSNPSRTPKPSATPDNRSKFLTVISTTSWEDNPALRKLGTTTSKSVPSRRHREHMNRVFSSIKPKEESGTRENSSKELSDATSIPASRRVACHSSAP